MIYRPVESTTLGLTYRSKVDYHLSGDVDASNVFGGVGGSGPIFLNASGDGSLDITLPEDHRLLGHPPARRPLDGDGRGDLYRWSRFDQLVVDNGLGLPIDEQQDYRDTWQYAAGLSYKVNPAWTLRGGIAYDQSPVKDAHRSPRVPTANRNLVSIGAGWTRSPT
nr:outer membrane protein transport protein [Salinicola tamaricis]